MDIKVNEAEWKGLSDADRATIESIIKTYFPAEAIKPESSADEAHDMINKGARKNAQALLSNPFCTAGCGIAEAVAVAACSALSGGVAIALCVAAAHVAGDLCRSRC